MAQKGAKMVSKVTKTPMITRDDLIAHIKVVGQRIIDDAEEITPDPNGTSFMEIRAIIAPATVATQIEYKIKRYADPRIKR